MESYLMFNAAISPHILNTFMSWSINQINGGATSLRVSFQTSGGEVNTGMAFANFISALPVPVTLHNTGAVGSMGIMIFASAQDRAANPFSSFVFHGAGLTTPNRLEEKQLSEWLETIRQQNETIASFVASRSEIATDECRQLITGENTKSAEWAHQKGLAQRIEPFSIPLGANVMTLFE